MLKRLAMQSEFAGAIVAMVRQTYMRLVLLQFLMGNSFRPVAFTFPYFVPELAFPRDPLPSPSILQLVISNPGTSIPVPSIVLQLIGLHQILL